MKPCEDLTRSGLTVLDADFAGAPTVGCSPTGPIAARVEPHTPCTGARHRNRLRGVPSPIPITTHDRQWLPDGSDFVYQNLRRRRRSLFRAACSSVGPATDHGGRSRCILFGRYTREENAALATT